jgi:transposase
MFLKRSTSIQRGRTYHSVLLTQSYREDGKNKHKTITNLSNASPEEIEAIDFALKNKQDLASIANLRTAGKKQEKSIGAVYVLFEIAKRLGIVKALGNSREAKLCLWMTIARLIQPGLSRLAAVRLAQRHMVKELLDLDEFTEDDLYGSLDWIDSKRRQIEERLYSHRYREAKPTLYLYDVTSSYLEGTENEFAAYGYNRDKKEGKMQIVIGLLTDDEGYPISIEVFDGDTRDFHTFSSQVRKLANQFGCERVAMVGDKGMIKSAQIEDIQDHNFLYVTSITKPQIESLVKQGTIQMELFSEELCEVKSGKDRFILRKNPVRARQMIASRKDRIEALSEFVQEQNNYLADHPRAELNVAQRKIIAKIDRYRLEEFVQVGTEANQIHLVIDEKALESLFILDGCYVIKSNIPSQEASMKTIHDRYKSLAHVEDGFRIMKTEFLEIRPIYLRRASRTRAHAFIVMLSYLITRYLEDQWKKIDLNVKEAIDALASVHPILIEHERGRTSFIPEPLPIVRQLISELNITLPEVLPAKQN